MSGLKLRLSRILRMTPFLLLAWALPVRAAVESASPAEAPARDPITIELRAAESAIYPGQNLVLKLIFKNDAEPPVTLDAAAFERETFQVLDEKGKPPKKVAPGGKAAEALRVDGYGTSERLIDLSAWYPSVAARKGVWKVSWSGGDRSAGPIKVAVTEPYDAAKDRIAVLETEVGVMTWELLPEHAPKHVKHFVDLVRQGFYDGLTFYRFVPGMELCGGDPKGDGTGGWRNLMMPEFSQNLVPVTGMVGALRPDGKVSLSSDSIFFIALGSPEFMQGLQSFYARMTEGWDVVARIAARETTGETGLSNANLLLRPVKIVRARIK